MDIHAHICENCGASNYNFHHEIIVCTICKIPLDISKELLLSEYDNKAKEIQSLSYDQAFRHLMHQKISSVKWNSDSIEIVTDQFRMVFCPKNDCCNAVWIEYVEGVELVLGKKVTDIRRNIQDVPESIDGDGFEEAISYTIVTEGGFLDVELRNNHNGYYGGKIALDSKVKFLR